VLEEILNTSKRRTLSAVAGTVLGVLGIALVTGGIIWSESLCKEECTCNSDRCCEISESCRTATPCLCLSVAADRPNGTCATVEKDRGKWSGFATAMIILGFYATAPLVSLFVCFFPVQWLVFALASKAQWSPCVQRFRHCGCSLRFRQLSFHLSKSLVDHSFFQLTRWKDCLTLNFFYQRMG